MKETMLSVIGKDQFIYAHMGSHGGCSESRRAGAEEADVNSNQFSKAFGLLTGNTNKGVFDFRFNILQWLRVSERGVVPDRTPTTTPFIPHHTILVQAILAFFPRLMDVV